MAIFWQNFSALKIWWANMFCLWIKGSLSCVEYKKYFEKLIFDLRDLFLLIWEICYSWFSQKGVEEIDLIKYNQSFSMKYFTLSISLTFLLTQTFLYWILQSSVQAPAQLKYSLLSPTHPATWRISLSK